MDPGAVVQLSPGPVKGLQLVVDDIERAHRMLTERGIETRVVKLMGKNPVPEAHGLDNVGMVFLSDPEGNGWAIQPMSGLHR